MQKNQEYQTMKEIIITASTEKGKKAIEQNQKESMKLKLKEKSMFKLMGYSQEYLENPKRAILRIKNPRYSTEEFIKVIKKEIIQSIKKNGAVEGRDYDIKIT